MDYSSECVSFTPRPASVKTRQNSGELADISAKQRPTSAMLEHSEASCTTNTAVTDNVTRAIEHGQRGFQARSLHSEYLVNTATVDTFRLIHRHLSDLSHFTISLPGAKSTKIVISGLPYYISDVEIQDALTDLEYTGDVLKRRTTIGSHLASFSATNDNLLAMFRKTLAHVFVVVADIKIGNAITARISRAILELWWATQRKLPGLL
ncbi:hypothetical protein J6590_088974 [Homalodisca vitripennis]|nr:hypothetical protein J6590_088974 [Homalodisca vitripennis]